MKITDIENMDVAALKAQQGPAAVAVKDDPKLAERYVQARLDAKVRDVKLKEQGEALARLQEEQGGKIALLQGAAAKMQERIAYVTQERDRIAQEGDGLQTELESARAALANAEAEFNGLRERSAAAVRKAHQERVALESELVEVRAALEAVRAERDELRAVELLEHS